MKSQEMVAQSVRHSRDLLSRYLVGFDDSNYTATAAGLPNHVGWCLGHLALTNNRFCGWLPRGRAELPAGDFVEGGASGDSERFGTESVSFGSDPRGGAVFPRYERCVRVFTDSVERLAGAIEGLSEEELVRPVAMFRGVESPPYLMAARAVYHVGIHNGQIADLRRALGMKGVLG
ncbi:MAG: DinB family protein [Phycisphaerales bacterium]|nr:DinB family protein [Planctomycetota bacterium]